MTRQVVLLAGGRGTRLGERSKTIPKPLIAVAQKPFIQYLVEEYRRFGFKHFLVLAGHLGDQFQSFFASQSATDIAVKVLVEPKPMGTGGALRFAQAQLEDTFLLANADSLFAINYLDLVRAPSEPNWLGKIALRWIDEADRYGAVVTSGERVIGFRERGDGGRGLINGGVYLLRREIIDQIGDGEVSLERDVFPPLAERGRLYGQVLAGPFIDIGVPDALAAAERMVPETITRPAAFLDRDGVLNVDKNYVCRLEDFEWIAGAKQAIKRLNDIGYLVIVVTNQAGVARGYYREDDVRALHGAIAEQLRHEGAHVDAFYYCPHHADGIVEPYARECDNRKPKPGMILRAMREWPVRRAGSFLIGDKQSDIEAGRRAGIPAHLFRGGNLQEFLERLLQELQPH